MSCDTTPDFETILSNKQTNSFVEALIKDQAFSIEFIASCIVNYYVTQLRKEPNNEDRG